MSRDTSQRTPFGVQPYKVYVALLTQSGTAAPTAIVLENSLGGIVWARSSAGIYTATLSGAFTTDKTAVLLGSTGLASRYALTSTSVITLTTFDDGFAADDNKMTNATIEIRVY